MIALLAFVLIDSAHASCYIPVYTLDETVPSGFEELFHNEVIQALSIWNSLRFPVTLTYMGETSRRQIDGSVTVGWSTDTGIYPRSIANTYNTVWPDGSITASKVELLSTKTWCPDSSAYDCFNMKNVLIHELGHVLGLTHVEDQTSVMRSSEPKGWALPIRPNEDDIDKLLSLYPNDDTGCGVKGQVRAWRTPH